jgi:hypothetical protein
MNARMHECMNELMNECMLEWRTWITTGWTPDGRLEVLGSQPASTTRLAPSSQRTVSPDTTVTCAMCDAHDEDDWSYSHV